MARSAATPEERRRWILEQVGERGSIRFADVRERFDRSAAQNDLRDLVREGRLVRAAHGSYRARPQSVAEKRREHPEEKAAIAGYIARAYGPRIKNVALDAGTSCTAVAEAFLEAGLAVNVFTSNLDAVRLLGGAPGVERVEVKGGWIHSRYAAVCGAMRPGECELGTVDLGVVGVSGISAVQGPGFGLSTVDTAQHPFKRWLVAQAATVLVPATPDKLGRQVGTVFSSFGRDPGAEKVRLVIASFGDEPEHERLRDLAAGLIRGTGAQAVFVHRDGSERDAIEG